MTVVDEVADERRRQIEGEGWSLQHDDDEHGAGELAKAAACYAISDRICDGALPNIWPWSAYWWKPKSRRRDLVRAAALIVAEIERLDRTAIGK